MEYNLQLRKAAEQRRKVERAVPAKLLSKDYAPGAEEAWGFGLCLCTSNVDTANQLSELNVEEGPTVISVLSQHVKK